MPPPDRVDAHLADLAAAGVFEQIAGLVIGRPYGYDQERATRLWTLASRWTRAANLPVLGNVECGHTDPMLTLPLGVRARLDASAKTFETLEPAVTDPPGREGWKDRYRR